MFSNVLSVAAVFGGAAFIAIMVLRSQHIAPLARNAIVGSALGLFLVSRYIQVDHSLGASIFAVGVALTMVAVAVGHLKAFPRAD